MSQTNTITVRRFFIALIFGVMIPGVQFFVLDNGNQDTTRRFKSLETELFQIWDTEAEVAKKDPKSPVTNSKDPVRYAEAVLADTDPVWATTTY